MKPVFTPWALAVLVVSGMLGCTGNAPRPVLRDSGESFGDERLEYVVNCLGRLDEFDDEAMRQQIISQLNAWVRGRKPPQGWELDPMIESLPDALREEPLVRALSEMEFHPHDGYTLYEAVTARDVSEWAAGERVDPVDQARHLFDWTVRNIQLEPGGATAPERDEDTPMQSPWHTLLFGRGTDLDRAWVFMLLLRQRAIDSALLAVPDPRNPERLKPWAVTVVTEDALYLFDPLVGLPIPSEDGVRLEPGSGLNIQPATLEEVVRNPEVLCRLAPEEETPYRVDAASLKNVTALLEASPAYLSARMDLLASQLVGDSRTVLTAIPSAIRERLAKHPHVKSVALWEHPFRVAASLAEPSEPLRESLAVRMRPFRLERRIERSIDRDEGEETVSQAQAPFMRYGDEAATERGERRVIRAAPLWKGRILYLKGHFVGKEAATHFFQMARPSATALSGIAAASTEDEESGAVQGAALKAAWERAKQDASYWLGLMNFERGKYGPAKDYFVKRVLDPPAGNLESSLESPWTSGATYNLARTFEAEGRLTDAIGTYRKNDAQPNRLQSVVRARLLDSVEQTGP